MPFSSFWQENRAALAAVAVALAALLACVTIVPETEQAVVVRFGEPVRVINRFRPNADFGSTGAGLIFRLPMAERLVRIDKRVLSVDMERQQVLSTDQQRIEVDAYARFRVIDPVRMVRSAGTTERLEEQLQPILSSVLRQELGKRTFQSLLTAERGQAMKNIRTGLDREAREYGAQIIDVRIKRADLPDGTPLESAFARMAAAREQEATTIVALGQKNAQITRATAEANAARVYAEAFNKDPAFYDFYRAMQSYDTTFSNPKNAGTSTILLSPESDYLRQFKGKAGN
ncbi:protease modulator HflC [Novosphingobium bradum]|uniref:Protein HflC n=1 Tax=Novosphingobium bradum TaxID=1737444 RepID=A0ABV7ISP8_9SPHN